MAVGPLPTASTTATNDPDPAPAGERMAVKLLRDQIRQRHHPERGDIPHDSIDPFREIPTRVLRVIRSPMAVACRAPIAARVTIWNRPRRLDLTINSHGSPRRAGTMVA